MDKQTKKETTIAAPLNLIPYIGGSIASIYTSIKSSKETERLEFFYSDIAEAVKTLDQKLTDALKNSKHDEEYLTMLIENLSRKVEKEARKGKQNAFKGFFTNALLNGITPDSYSQLDFYLESLDSLSEIDIQLLLLLHNEIDKLIPIKDINSTGFNDPYFILASVNKLRNLGFIMIHTGDIHVGARDNALEERIKLSTLGKDFISFCLS